MTARTSKGSTILLYLSPRTHRHRWRFRKHSQLLEPDSALVEFPNGLLGKRLYSVQVGFCTVTPALKYFCFEQMGLICHFKFHLIVKSLLLMFVDQSDFNRKWKAAGAVWGEWWNKKHDNSNQSPKLSANTSRFFGHVLAGLIKGQNQGTTLLNENKAVIQSHVYAMTQTGIQTSTTW